MEEPFINVPMGRVSFWQLGMVEEPFINVPMGRVSF